jgi:hypothetical protein
MKTYTDDSKIMSRPISGVTYKDEFRIGNWIYSLRLHPQQITAN